MSSEFMGRFSIGQTIDRGIHLYRRALGKMLMLILFPSIVSLFTQTWMQQYMVQPWFASSGGIISFVAIMVISSLAWGYMMIALTRFLAELTQGKEIKSLQKILKLVTLKDFLYIITIIIWYLVAAISMLILVIPFIYLINIAFLVAVPVVLVEKRYFFSGIVRLFSLTRGRWWKTFVINLITVLITFVPIMIAYSFMMWCLVQSRGGVEGMMDPTTTMAAYSPLAIIGALVYTAILALATPLFSSVGMIHYNSLRSEKEHSDLDNRLDSLSG